MQNYNYTITVKPKCYCKNGEKDKVLLRLLYDSGNGNSDIISSNSVSTNWKCSTEYTFLNKSKSDVRKNLRVRITHVGCSGDINEMRLVGNCNQTNINGKTFTFDCDESKFKKVF